MRSMKTTSLVKGSGAAAAGAALVLSLTACPNGNVVRPEDPSYADAVGGQSTPVIEGHGEPLVVDWRPDHRGDLEVAMREGVAVVSYTKEGMRLLKGCHANGKYGFLGMTLKEQVISLEDENEIRANLPLSGVGIAGKLGGELRQGTVLNIAMALVGKHRTTNQEVPRDALEGRCDGATHFVAGATVGAFVLKTAARGEASTAAEVFSVGASAETSSAKNVMNKDGDIASCRKASPDEASPPDGCTALIRLDLESIAPVAAKTHTPAVKTSWAPNPCPPGMALSAGKCAVPTAQRPHQCDPRDVADCSAQCDRGQPESCVNLGFAHERGQGAPRDLPRASQLYAKACELGSALGCHNAGYLLHEGEGMTHDPAKAVGLFEKACLGGEARGCNSLGAALFAGAGIPQDASRAGKLFQRACSGGEPAGCTNLGTLLLTGTLGDRNPLLATSLFERACQGHDLSGCTSLASAFETGSGVQADLGRAVRLYESSCESEYAYACYSLSVLATLGKGTAKDPSRARSLLERACQAKEVMACATLRVVHGQQASVDPREVDLYRATYEKTCNAGDAADCTNLGILLSASGDAAGKSWMQKGCSLGDAWGCHVSK
jgi:hypothetical protein